MFITWMLMMKVFFSPNHEFKYALIVRVHKLFTIKIKCHNS